MFKDPGIMTRIPANRAQHRFLLIPPLPISKFTRVHSWYRGGFQPVQDGPVLLKKFDAFLDRLVSDGDPQEKIGRILRALSQEPNVVAAIWGSLLVAGTRQPSLWAQQLLPLASAAPIMLSSDTRYQLGNFIGAVYEHLPKSGRGVIERAILSLPDDRAGERSKAALAGCIPKARVATDEMQVFLETLQQAGKTRPNAPPFQITSSTRPFDTDAYLASEGVSLEDPDSAALRELMRGVEALSTPGGTPSLSLTSVKRQVGIFDGIRKALLQRFRGRVPDKLFDHAVGQMAEAAGRIARSQPRVLAAPSVKGPLKRVLLFSAASESPHYNPEHERDFHENLSWGGPSARTAAAHGLLDFTRASKKRDPQIMAAIRNLARDRVPEVRLQIVQNLSMLRTLDPAWAWSEVEHVLAEEVTRGVVASAIDALSGIAYLDIPRAIRAAKGVIRRYRNKSKAGMAACRSSATALIFDIHVNVTNAEADEFAATLMGDVVSNAADIRQFVARYSDNLLRGSLENAQAPDNRPRQKTISFYQSITEQAFREIEKRAALLDIRKFDTWPEADQAAVRDMLGILDEVSLRFHSAAGILTMALCPLTTFLPSAQDCIGKPSQS